MFNTPFPTGEVRISFGEVSVLTGIGVFRGVIDVDFTAEGYTMKAPLNQVIDPW